MDRMGVEWVAPGDAGELGDAIDSPVELVEQGRQPVRRRRVAIRVPQLPLAVRVIGFGVVSAAVVTAALTSHRAPTVAHGDRAAPAAEQVATDRAIALVEASARTDGILRDYIRSNSTPGACPLVPVGGSPQDRIATAITRELAGYTVRDVSRTIDQFTALCALSVRAADPEGSVLVVSVAAPQRSTSRAFTDLTVGARTDTHDSVSIATAQTTTGWSITVGVVGPLADEPSSADLQRLSQDPALRW